MKIVISMKRQIILMMVLMVYYGGAGVIMATDQDAAPSAVALSERTLSDLVDQVKIGIRDNSVKKELRSRIEKMSELSQENVDVLSGVASWYSLPGDAAKKKIKELCMKILASNQLGQLLRDCSNGSDKVLARKKVEMLFTHCDVDITQANLVELAPAMKAFQDNVRTEDPAAKAVDHCYYGHHNKYDLRDYYSVWQKKPVEELKAELKMLQDIVEDHTVYDWVKWFYKKVKTDLINEIILKEPSFYNDPALGSDKYSISVKAQKAVDAWQKKTEADEKIAKESAKEAEGKKRKTMPMGELVKEFEQGYKNHAYGDAEAEFKEREISERENLQKDYQNKSFDDLKTLQKTLGAEKKKYKKSSERHGFYRLRNQWIALQLDEAGNALLEKLNDAKPEDYQTLYDDNYNDNRDFSNKICSAIEKREAEITSELVQTYQKLSDAEISKLVEKLFKEVYSTNKMKVTINLFIINAIEKAQKKQIKGGASDKVMVALDTNRSGYSSDSTTDSTSKEPVSPRNDVVLKEDTENEDADEMENVVAKETRMSLEELTDYLKQILGIDWERRIDQALNDDKGRSKNTVQRKKQSIFNALLKVDTSVFLDKLGTKTKYSFLHQFNLMAFTDAAKIKRNKKMLKDQVFIDLQIVPLEKFSRRLDDAYEKNSALEESMHDRQERLDDLVHKITYESPATPKLKKEIISAYLRKIGGFVQFFKKETSGLDGVKNLDRVKNFAKQFAKKAGLTFEIIQKNLKISGMDENDQDYPAVMMFLDLLNANDKKQGAIKKRSISQPKKNRSSSSPKRNRRRNSLRDGAGSAA